MEAMVEILLHIPDCTLGFYLPFLPPRFEALDGFSAAGSVDSIFRPSYAKFKVPLFKLDSYVPRLVNDVSLYLEERINFTSRPVGVPDCHR